MIYEAKFKIGDKTILSSNFGQNVLKLFNFKCSFPSLPGKQNLIYYFNTNASKLFKNGPSKICGRQPLKNLKGYPLKFYKGCLLQILLGPFLNTSSQVIVVL